MCARGLDMKMASAGSTQSSNSSENSDKSIKQRFKWNEGDKIENLLIALQNYKSCMEFNNVDFNADKPKQYEAVRRTLALIYEADPYQFGPADVCSFTLHSNTDEDERSRILAQQKLDKELIKKGYNRVQEKIKEIRQNFSNAVTAGTRSGSGKLVLEHYDRLVLIWGGTPATEPLQCGISSDQLNSDTSTNTDSEQPSSLEESADDSSLQEKVASTEQRESQENTENSAARGSFKRKAGENPAPKLIDNKRKHMERQLSAAQRDEILMNESKEDAQFKRDIAEAIRQSNETFAQTMQQMSNSILQVANGLTRSVEMMSQVILQRPQTLPPAPPPPPHNFAHSAYTFPGQQGNQFGGAVRYPPAAYFGNHSYQRQNVNHIPFRRCESQNPQSSNNTAVPVSADENNMTVSDENTTYTTLQPMKE